MIPQPTLSHLKSEYTWVEKKGEEMVCLRLVRPPFAGVVYHYGKVWIEGERDEDGNSNVHFQYHIKEIPKDFNTTLFESQDFDNLLGDILLHVLEEASIRKAQNDAGMPDPDLQEPEIITIELDGGENGEG